MSFPELKIPPPPFSAVLPEMALSMTVKAPVFSIPPPSPP